MPQVMSNPSAEKKVSPPITLFSVFTQLYSKLAPQQSRRSLIKIFSRPLSVPVPMATTSHDMHIFKIMTSQGPIRIHHQGSGETILIVHGLSMGLVHYSRLMQDLVGAGFHVVTYDQPAHGESAGKFAHLPIFVKTLSEIYPVLAKTFIMQGVIGLGLGANAVLAAGLDLKAVFIEPEREYREQMYRRVAQYGYSRDMFNDAIAYIEREFGMPFDYPRLQMLVQDKVADSQLIHLGNALWAATASAHVKQVEGVNLLGLANHSADICCNFFAEPHG